MTVERASNYVSFFADADGSFRAVGSLPGDDPTTSDMLVGWRSGPEPLVIVVRGDDLAERQAEEIARERLAENGWGEAKRDADFVLRVA